MPSWCDDRPNDPLAKQRRRARLLWERAAHGATGEHEAQACRERAEDIHKRYGL
jgi:hypothetical protein